MNRRRSPSSFLVGGLALAGMLVLGAAFIAALLHQGEQPASALPTTITALRQELEQSRRQHRRAEETNRQLQQTIWAFTQAEGSSPPGSDEAEQVDRQRAIEIATSYLGGGTVVEVEREREHGSLVYEVTFDNESKVYVEVASGRVVYAHIRGASGEEEEDDDDYEEEEDDDDD